jgi:FkbM family methyltransferase
MIRSIIVIFRAVTCLSLSGLFSANVSENTLDQALDLSRQGLEYLTSSVDEGELQRIYSGDGNLIENFPFSNYELVDVPNQGSFFVDRINDSIKNTLRAGQPWEWLNKLIIEAYTKPGTIALDIGAHIGTHTLTMSECVGPQGMVLAFEPNKKIYRELCLNLSINNCTNVRPIRCAIGKERGTIQIVVSHPQNEGGCYVIKESGGSNTASMIRLDDLQLSNVSFIKIDVENMEGDVLDGAVNTIKRCRPVILIEIQGNGERPMQMDEDTQKMAQENIRKIEALDYHLQSVGGVDYLAIPN